MVMKKSLHSFLHTLLLVIALAGLSLLGGCSGMRLVDSDVRSFAVWQPSPPAPGTAYRFERLPSQQQLQLGQPFGADELSQDQLEAVASTVLQKFGLTNDPAAAVLDVQISATTLYSPAYAYGPGPYAGSGFALGTGTGGGFVGLSFPLMRYEPPLYTRELGVVMRDSRTHAVVYETRARHTGVWADARGIFGAIMQAGMQGFPQPPTGPRRVRVEIPR